MPIRSTLRFNVIEITLFSTPHKTQLILGFNISTPFFTSLWYRPQPIVLSRTLDHSTSISLDSVAIFSLFRQSLRIIFKFLIKYVCRWIPFHAECFVWPKLYISVQLAASLWCLCKHHVMVPKFANITILMHFRQILTHNTNVNLFDGFTQYDNGSCKQL